MPEDRHSRTEKPTARRKKEARREGRVARTPEVVTWLVVLVGTYVVQYTLRSSYALLLGLWGELTDDMSHPSVATDLALAGKGLGGALTAVAPALLAAMGSALVINLAQTRGLVTLEPLKPQVSKLNPAKGVKRLFAPQSAWNVAKQLARVALLGLIAWRTLAALIPALVGSGPLSSYAVASLVGSRALSLAREVAAIGLALSVADYIVQYRKVATQLKMTKQEVKEEQKASDGNPLTKNQLRRRMRRTARNRMIAAVGKADAVVVNPTHFAVALSYVRGQRAPKVVAKGIDFLALRIREEAMEHKVPVVEDPPLARALYVACDLEDEIPVALYEAVARLLTFIYGLKAQGRLQRVDGAPLKPASPLMGRNFAAAFAPVKAGGGGGRGAGGRGRGGVGGGRGSDGDEDDEGDEGDEGRLPAPVRPARPVRLGEGGGGGPVSAIGSLM
ncbi:MAG TPA: EscU/YscU/HrcU family type III secretion system export apparatus switch protein [Acidimicrobiales bacterium]|nr:EscU/YscU/HrcU family type III secretion system export apparatus switch protein [Acidimicrobiales bacterium]